MTNERGILHSMKRRSIYTKAEADSPTANNFEELFAARLILNNNYSLYLI